MIRILYIEDEINIRNIVVEALTSSGMSVEWTDNLDQAIEILKTHSIDIIILDRLLHGSDSLMGLSNLRSQSRDKPLLILSALSEIDDRIAGLDHGADDYLGKPFEIRELISKIYALHRRAIKPPLSPETIKIGDLTINLHSREAHRAGSRLDLSVQEFRLLAALAGQATAVPKKELLNIVWGTENPPDANVLEVAMGRLRNKIDQPGMLPLIHTKRNIGYFLGEHK